MQPLLSELELLNNEPKFLLTMWNHDDMGFKEYTCSIGNILVVYTQEFEGKKLINHYTEVGIRHHFIKLSQIRTGTDLITLVNLLANG